MSIPTPLETPSHEVIAKYRNPVCRGSYLLRTNCGRCERCKEQEHLFGVNAPKIEPTFAAEPAAKGLPVAGYRAEQPAWAVALVNQNKALEELVFRQIDKAEKLKVPETRTESRGHYGDHDYDVQVKACDGRQLALARTKLEEAFYHLNRAVFQPKRIDGELSLAFIAEDLAK